MRDPIRRAEWKVANAERAKIWREKWSAANPEKERAKKRAKDARYRARNRDERMASHKRWESKNPEVVAALRQNRRARVKAVGGSFTADDIKDITRLQGGRCAYCKEAVKLSVDHIEPVSRGGSNDRRNLQMACIPCNSAKGARDPFEFARSLGLLL